MFDTDEFEGIETIKKPAKEVEEEQASVPGMSPRFLVFAVTVYLLLIPVQPQQPPKPKFGALEMCYITFIAIFLVNYYMGKKKNEKIATTWYTSALFFSTFSNSFLN